MKRIFLVIYYVAIPSLIIAQLPTLQWADKFGGNEIGYGTSVKVDQKGNVYTIGWIEGTTDFDPGQGTYNLTSKGGRDFFVSKLDSTGHFLWANSFGNLSDDYAYSICLDSSGNAFVTGSFYGSVDFDPGSGTFILASSGLDDIFILKLDKNGAFTWAKNIGGNIGDSGRSITTDAWGNIYLTGNFSGTVDFDPGPGINNLYYVGARDIFILKLDIHGIFVWAKQMGGNSIDESKELVIDRYGNIISTGIFQNVADFDPGPGIYNMTSDGGNDIYISTLDNNGNFISAKKIGGASNEYINDLFLDFKGNLYMSGYFWATADFDPSTAVFNMTSIGLTDFFILKLDSSQNFLWSKSIGGSFYDQAYGVISDFDGNVYTVGYFMGTVDFDPGLNVYNQISTGGSDIFISLLDSVGNFISANRLGDTKNDSPSCLTIDQKGNIYSTGGFQGIVDFDTGINTFNLVSVDTSEVFVYKLSKTKLELTINDNIFMETFNISFYPNPSTEILNIYAESISQSVITIQLTDLSGKLLFEGILNDDKKSIPISHLLSGTYFLKLMDNKNNKYVSKFIKE